MFQVNNIFSNSLIFYHLPLISEIISFSQFIIILLKSKFKLILFSVFFGRGLIWFLMTDLEQVALFGQFSLSLSLSLFHTHILSPLCGLCLINMMLSNLDYDFQTTALLLPLPYYNGRMCCGRRGVVVIYLVCGMPKSRTSNVIKSVNLVCLKLELQMWSNLSIYILKTSNINVLILSMFGGLLAKEFLLGLTIISI